jgi:hypothetical protein
MEIFYFVKSDKPNKKYKIIYNNPITGTNKSLYFGDSAYSDYTINKDDLRKNRYILRHYKRENWTYSGRFSPGFWSRWILWNKKTISQSIKNTEKRFNIKIIYIQ